MPSTITRGYKKLLDEANGQVETINAAEAVERFPNGGVGLSEQRAVGLVVQPLVELPDQVVVLGRGRADVRRKNLADLGLRAQRHRLVALGIDRLQPVGVGHEPLRHATLLDGLARGFVDLGERPDADAGAREGQQQHGREGEKEPASEDVAGAGGGEEKVGVWSHARIRPRACDWALTRSRVWRTGRERACLGGESRCGGRVGGASTGIEGCAKNRMNP